MKKFVSGILALAMVAATAVSSVASAAGSFIPGKDPNGDGVLTLADSVYIRQVLGGKFIPSDLTQLDVDDNCVVSMADVVMTQRAEIGIYSASEMESADSPMNVEASTSTSRDYDVYKVNSTTHKCTYDRSYSLSVENDDNGISPYVYGGEDERDVTWKHIGVAKIMSDNTHTDVPYFGTGFVVGKHVIATARHVSKLAVTEQYGKMTEILLINEDGRIKKLTPVEIHMPQDTILGCDYSLITVKEDLSDYMSFNLGMVTDYADDEQIEVSVVGYPMTVGTDDKANTDRMHRKYVGKGNVRFVNNKFRMGYTADTSGGNSGSPVYVTEIVNGVTYYTVVGIHTHEGNNGVRLTPETLKFFCGNTNFQY